MRRGFKSEANAIAREVRAELSLSRTSPLDVWTTGRASRHSCDPTVQLATKRPLKLRECS